MRREDERKGKEMKGKEMKRSYFRVWSKYASDIRANRRITSLSKKLKKPESEISPIFSFMFKKFQSYDYAEFATYRTIKYNDDLDNVSKILSYHRKDPNSFGSMKNLLSKSTLDAGLEILQSAIPDHDKISPEKGKILYSDKNQLVTSVKNKEESIKRGEGSSWCISKPGNKLFDKYTSQGFNFVMYKNKKHKYMFTYMHGDAHRLYKMLNIPVEGFGGEIEKVTIFNEKDNVIPENRFKEENPWFTDKINEIIISELKKPQDSLVEKFIRYYENKKFENKNNSELNKDRKFFSQTPITAYAFSMLIDRKPHKDTADGTGVSDFTSHYINNHYFDSLDLHTKVHRNLMKRNRNGVDAMLDSPNPIKSFIETWGPEAPHRKQWDDLWTEGNFRSFIHNTHDEPILYKMFVVDKIKECITKYELSVTDVFIIISSFNYLVEDLPETEKTVISLFFLRKKINNRELLLKFIKKTIRDVDVYSPAAMEFIKNDFRNGFTTKDFLIPFFKSQKLTPKEFMELGNFGLPVIITLGIVESFDFDPKDMNKIISSYVKSFDDDVLKLYLSKPWINDETRQEIMKLMDEFDFQCKDNDFAPADLARITEEGIDTYSSMKDLSKLRDNMIKKEGREAYVSLSVKSAREFLEEHDTRDEFPYFLEEKLKGELSEENEIDLPIKNMRRKAGNLSVIFTPGIT